MEKRLTATLKHAGKVMATTSLSTCVSFISNTTSMFPAVYRFGAFAAWLVFVNYCAVVLFYPTVLAVHDRYFYTPRLKRGCCVTKKCSENNKDCCKSCCFRDNTNMDLGDSGEVEQRAIDKLFEVTVYPWIEGRRRHILMATLVFFLVFFMLTSQLEADPEIPQFFPAGNNYNEYGAALTDNFASETGLQLTARVVWGLEGIDREGTDPTLFDEIGEPIYSEEGVSFLTADEQRYIAQFCDDLLCVYSDYSCRYPESTYYDLLISDPESYGGYRTNVVKCFMTEFREWVETDSKAMLNASDIEEYLIEYNVSATADAFADCEWGVFPVEGEHCMLFLYGVVWLNDDLPTASPDYVAGTTNYDYWKDQIRLKEVVDGNSSFGELELKFFEISILTEADIAYAYQDGVALFDDWLQFADQWRDNEDGQTSADRYGDDYVATPSALQSVMVADPGFFSYFFIQQQIIREAFMGIGLSLMFAFIVLTLATGNWMMAIYSVCTIFAIVICVIGFTVANGWKLGVIEAVIYVMVVGMSVDYVVHLSEAYLASGKHSREDRTRRMLGIVGGSVLSGAMSTFVGILWLLFAQIVIFLKFGAFICFLIACSVTFSMVSFTAAMSSFGPEGTSGDIVVCYRRCRRFIDEKRSGSASSSSMANEKGASHVEMR